MTRTYHHIVHVILCAWMLISCTSESTQPTPTPAVVDIATGSAAVASIALIDNGATLAVLDKTRVTFYATASGTILRSIDVTNPDPTLAAGTFLRFAKGDSLMVISGTWPESLRIFDRWTGKLVTGIAAVYEGFLTSDGKFVISDDGYGNVREYDAMTGARTRIFSNPGDLRSPLHVMGLQYGGAAFIDTSYSGSIVRVWNIPTDDMGRVVTVGTTISAMRLLSNDGTMFCSQVKTALGRPDALQFHDLTTGNAVATLPRSDTAHPMAIIAPNLRFIEWSDSVVVRMVANGAYSKTLPSPPSTLPPTLTVTDAAGMRAAAFFAKKSGTSGANVVRVWAL